MVGLVVEELTFLDTGPYSFAVPPGECLGLTGPSGVGKSQLLRAIADLIPHSGTVRWNGLEAVQYPAPAWRAQICLVPSESSWWYERVGDHLAMGLAQAFVAECLQRLDFLPDVLNWRVSRLSTGEKQRLAVLRALVRRPVALLLDEPTSGLDSIRAGQVEELLRDYRLQRPASLLWVSHDRQQLERVARRLLVVGKKGLADC